MGLQCLEPRTLPIAWLLHYLFQYSQVTFFSIAQKIEKLRRLKQGNVFFGNNCEIALLLPISFNSKFLYSLVTLQGEICVIHSFDYLTIYLLHFSA